MGELEVVRSQVGTGLKPFLPSSNNLTFLFSFTTRFSCGVTALTAPSSFRVYKNPRQLPFPAMPQLESSC